MKQIDETYSNLKAPCELWGVDTVSDIAITYRIAVKVKATKDFEIERKMKKDFRVALDKAKIKVPHQQVEVYHE